MNKNNLLSDTLRFIRFPLILGVIYRHFAASDVILQGVDLEAGQRFVWLELLQRIFCDIFGGIRVPVFFFMSGLLFFRNYTAPSRQFYGKQLSKRVDSLIVPYIFWNALLILLYLIGQHTPVLSTLFSGRFKQIADYGLADYLDAFGITSELPVSFHFWFVRDLIAVSLLTPLIAYTLRKLKMIPIIIVYILWIMEDRLIPDLHMSTLCFFSLGAYFSIYKIDLLAFCEKYSVPMLTLFITHVLIYLTLPGNLFGSYLGYLAVPAGIFALFYATSRMLSRYNVHPNWFILSDMSFFLFAVHEPFQAFLKKSLYLVLKPESELLMIALFLVTPLFITGCVWYSYQHLVNYLPEKIKQAMGIRRSPVSTINRVAAEKSPKLSTPS